MKVVGDCRGLRCVLWVGQWATGMGDCGILGVSGCWVCRLEARGADMLVLAVGGEGAVAAIPLLTNLFS